MSGLLGRILLLGVLAAADQGVVIAPALDVFQEPSGTSYSIGQLQRGDRVEIINEKPGGWLVIAPPSWAFLWIDEAGLTHRSDQVAVVRSERATARAGREGARMPGPPDWVLPEGQVVRLLDSPKPLVLRQGGGRRVWRAIAPPEGLVRFIRADGVKPLDQPIPQARFASSLNAGLSPAIQALAHPGAALPPGSLPASAAAEFRQADLEHRAMLRTPMQSWRMGRIRDRYQALLEAARDPAARAAIQDRLDRVARQDAAAAAARGVSDLLQTSRRRIDPDELASRPIVTPPSPSRGFDATGLLQASSKLANGERVHALIGSDGLVVAYLRTPTGVRADLMFGRQVGIHGKRRYNEALRAEVIDVTDMEPIDRVEWPR